MNLPQDKKFGRVTTPEIYSAYKEYVATGKYPYLDDVTSFVADKYSVSDTEQLRHELYIASSMYTVERNQKLEAELKDKGFTPITDFEFTKGQKIILQGVDTPMRVSQDAQGNWFAMPPRHTRNGYNLTARRYQHSAYLQDVQDGREGMRGGKVVMVKEV